MPDTSRRPLTGPGRHDGRLPAILAIDTATSRVVVAIGRPDGTPVGMTTWLAGHRHGETLLPTLGRVLGENNVRRARLKAIVVGTGPGTFTGLRVGRRHRQGAGPRAGHPDRGRRDERRAPRRGGGGPGTPAAGQRTWPCSCRPGRRTGCSSSAAGPSASRPARNRTSRPRPCSSPSTWPGGHRRRASALGERALEGLGAAMLRLGARRLAEGDTDDLAGLVPEYVTLPRGIERESRER